MKRKLFLILFIVCFGIICHAAAEEIDIEKQLDEFYREYKKIQFENQQDEVEPLVKLDTELRKFLRAISDGNVKYRFWKSHYSELSLSIGHYSDEFEYEGMLLAKAHKINPNSEYREYTLFSEINSEQWCWVENPQNVEAAHKYLEEFPDGPYVTRVYYLLGRFYSSLYDSFKYIKEELRSRPLEELKDYHLIRYVKDPSIEPLDEQEEKARAKAIKYLELFLKLEENPGRHEIKWANGMLKEIKSGTEVDFGVFSCPD